MSCKEKCLSSPPANTITHHMSEMMLLKTVIVVMEASIKVVHTLKMARDTGNENSTMKFEIHHVK